MTLDPLACCSLTSLNLVSDGTLLDLHATHHDLESLLHNIQNLCFCLPLQGSHCSGSRQHKVTARKIDGCKLFTIFNSTSALEVLTQRQEARVGWGGGGVELTIRACLLWLLHEMSSQSCDC